MDDVADEETDSETHRKELRIFKIKRDIKRDTEIKEATSDVGDDDSPQIEDRTSVREIAQYFGALHEPLFAAKIRSTDDDNSRVSSLAKSIAPPPSSHSELEPSFPQHERNNQSAIESAASPVSPKCTAQFSGQTEDLVLKSKTISTSVTSFDSTQLSTNTSTDRCEFPPSMGAQISKSTVPPDHHPNEDARQDSYRLPEVVPQTVTNLSGTPAIRNESPAVTSNLLATSAATKTDEQDECSEAYNHIVQFITHSSVSKLRNITDGGGTTIDRNHQMTIPDADSTKESVSSPGLTEASDSCALIGSVQTDIDSDTSMTGGDGDETEEVNKQAVTQKAVIADISAPIPSRSGNTNQEQPRVQTIVMKKKRSNECFTDANVDGSRSKSCGNQSRAESKTLIISDPQTAAVSATISLGRSKKLSPQKSGKCSRATSSTAATFAAPSQAVAVQKPMFANFASTLSTRPVLVVHPAQKTFSQTAIHTYNKFSLGEPNLKFATSSAITSYDNIVSDLTNKSTGKPYSQTDSSTLKNEIPSLRVSRINDDSRESLTNRLSRGLVDLTQGSSDRLQRWKSKLQTGRRPKDTSEPPPVIRNMPSNHEPSGHSSDAEVILNWAPSRFIPLQPSPSPKFISNNKSAFTTQILRPRVLHPSLSATDILRPADTDKEFVSLLHRFLSSSNFLIYEPSSWKCSIFRVISYRS
uniref:Bm3820 n=1 Tax=Parascaris univalens TaxID=6257 RepID=A0A915BXI5_PARUN